MSENPVTVDGGGGGGLPATLEPSLQERIRAGVFSPHGDRRERTQSCRVVDQEVLRPSLEHHVAGELVLVDHVDELITRRKCPPHCGLQGVLFGHGASQIAKSGWRQPGSILDGKHAHQDSVMSEMGPDKAVKS